MSSGPHTGKTLLSIPNFEKDEDLISELLPGLDKIAQECVVPSMEDIAKFNKPVALITGVGSRTGADSSEKPKSLFGIDKGRSRSLTTSSSRWTWSDASRHSKGRRISVGLGGPELIAEFEVTVCPRSLECRTDTDRWWRPLPS